MDTGILRLLFLRWQSAHHTCGVHEVALQRPCEVVRVRKIKVAVQVHALHEVDVAGATVVQKMTVAGGDGKPGHLISLSIWSISAVLLLMRACGAVVTVMDSDHLGIVHVIDDVPAQHGHLASLGGDQDVVAFREPDEPCGGQIRYTMKHLC